jgi:ketosteroid isomerase-like protein
MSRENVEVMGTWIEAFNRGDMEALLAVTHPDFEFRTSGVFPDLDPIYKGHAGFKRFYDDFTGPWESFSVSVQELRDCGECGLSLVVSKVTDATAWRRAARTQVSGPSATAKRFRFRTTKAGHRPSKPWGCGSRVAASAARNPLLPSRYGTAHRLSGPGARSSG